MLPPDIAQLVDEFLAAEKRLLGVVTEADWKATQFEGERRITWSLMVGDESVPDHNLILQAYPNLKPVRWHISLAAPKSVFRIDCQHGAKHTNSFSRPADLKEHIIRGPHYHAWADNRRFCTPNALPDRLRNARQLPAKHLGFQNALRWFCAEAKIALPANDLIDLPRTDALL